MKKIDKNYDFESPAPTAKTLHSRYEMRLSSNEQPAPSTRGVLIGRAGEPRGEIGKVCCLLLVFKGDKWAYRPKKTRPSDSWINYESDGIRFVTENPDCHVQKSVAKHCKYRCKRHKMAIFVGFHGKYQHLYFKNVIKKYCCRHRITVYAIWSPKR